MNEHLTMNSQSTRDGAKAESPGLILRRKREASNLSQQDVAKHLYLTTQVIAALENDDFSKLAGMTFVKGYLRCYAQFLNLSGDDVIAALNTLGINESAGTNVRVNLYKVEANPHDRNMRWVTFGIAFGLIILVLVWWRTESSSHATNTTKAAATQASSIAVNSMTNSLSDVDNNNEQSLQKQQLSLPAINSKMAEESSLTTKNPVMNNSSLGQLANSENDDSANQDTTVAEKTPVKTGKKHKVDVVELNPPVDE